MAELDQTSSDVLGRLRLDAQQFPSITPSLLAFLRGIGSTISTAEDTRASARGMIQAQDASSRDTIRMASGRERRALTSRLINRGGMRSGAALRQYREQRENTDRRLNDLGRGTADRLTAVEQAYRGAFDAAKNTTLERLLANEEQVAVKKAEDDARLREQDQMRQFYERMARGEV